MGKLSTPDFKPVFIASLIIVAAVGLTLSLSSPALLGTRSIRSARAPSASTYSVPTVTPQGIGGILGAVPKALEKIGISGGGGSGGSSMSFAPYDIYVDARRGVPYPPIDPNCWRYPSGWLDAWRTVWPLPLPVGSCSDGKDNDGDQKIDGQDSGCLFGDPNYSNSGKAPPYELANPYTSSADDRYLSCADNADNDGDGRVDYLDKDCQHPVTNDYMTLAKEHSNDPSYVMGECENGVDDDGDGVVDTKDSGCYGNRSPNSPIQYFLNPQLKEKVLGLDTHRPCTDNIDNDVLKDKRWSGPPFGQEWIDGGDSACVFWSNGSCDLAVGNPPRYMGYMLSFDEKYGGQFNGSECFDFVDNDSDGEIDSEDSGCLYRFGASAPGMGIWEWSANYHECLTNISALDCHDADPGRTCVDNVDNDGDAGTFGGGGIDGWDWDCTEDGLLNTTYNEIGPPPP